MIANYSNLFGIYYHAPSSILNLHDRHVTLFIHGAGGSHKHWRSIINNISPLIAPICIDLPGHGNSPGYVPDSMEELLSVLAQFLIDLGIKCQISIVGHSFGGLVAQAFTIKNQNQVNKLVLISTAANMMLHPQLLKQLSSGSLDIDFLCKGFAQNMSDPIKWMLINDLALTRLNKNISDFMNISSINLMDDLKTIVSPTFILYGDQDRVISPRRVKAMARSIRNSSIHLIKGVSHYPHLEKPGEVADFINNFLIH